MTIPSSITINGLFIDRPKKQVSTRLSKFLRAVFHHHLCYTLSDSLRNAPLWMWWWWWFSPLILDIFSNLQKSGGKKEQKGVQTSSARFNRLLDGKLVAWFPRPCFWKVGLPRGWRAWKVRLGHPFFHTWIPSVHRNRLYPHIKIHSDATSFFYPSTQSFKLA